MLTNYSFRNTILLLVLCTLPLVVLSLVVTGVLNFSLWIVISILLLCAFGMYFATECPDSRPDPQDYFDNLSADLPIEAPPDDLLVRTRDIIDPIIGFIAGNRYIIEGYLKIDPDDAYDLLQHRFDNDPFIPTLRTGDNGRTLLALIPKVTERASGVYGERRWINVALVLATLLTTAWAGAAHLGLDVLKNPGNLSAGLPYAASLMLILSAHEFGHYITASRYGMSVSWPYFIPIPFALGTFGAFIKMRSPAPNRRTMFDVAVAGPIAGLVFIIPALIGGLQFSTVVLEPGGQSGIMGGGDVGSSILFAFLSKVALGDALLDGHRLILHPVAFAGWLGLLVTALNLIPIGQLDGGHMSSALFGRRIAQTVAQFALISLVLLGLFVWTGLLLWALIVFLIAGKVSPVPPNDVSRLDRRRLVLGFMVFSILLMILIPVPHALYPSFGIHCPYL